MNIPPHVPPPRTPKGDRIHFVVLAIGATAKKLGISNQEMYNRLKAHDLIKTFLLDCYDTLHCESIDGVVWNVTEALKVREQNAAKTSSQQPQKE